MKCALIVEVNSRVESGQTDATPFLFTLAFCHGKMPSNVTDDQLCL